MKALRFVRTVGSTGPLAVIVLVFVVPFAFIVLTAAKDRAKLAPGLHALPTDWLLIDNFGAVIGTRTT